VLATIWSISFFLRFFLPLLSTFYTNVLISQVMIKYRPKHVINNITNKYIKAQYNPLEHTGGLL